MNRRSRAQDDNSYVQFPGEVHSYHAIRGLKDGGRLKIEVVQPIQLAGEVPPIMPLPVQLIEFKGSEREKRGDLYLFAGDRTDCVAHWASQAPTGGVMNYSGLPDGDTSRLSEFRSEIGLLLNSVNLPPALECHRVVRALLEGSL